MDQLVPATNANKEKLARWAMAVSPRNSADIITVLELAFKQQPDLIFLVTDGDFDDNQGVIDWLTKHNNKLQIRINTIGLDRDAAEGPERVLKQIAKQNGGVYSKRKAE